MSGTDNQQRRTLILGASGRVGKLITASGELGETILQSRRAGQGDLVWDMLDAPPEIPQFSGIVMLAGGVSDTGNYIPLARAAARLGAERGVPVLIASSQSVYGPAPGPHDEDGPCAPAADYGRAKLAMEAAMAAYPGVTCLRIGNVAGADMLFRSMAAGPVELDEVSPGVGPRRAMIGPVTLARALRDLIGQSERPRILNLAQPGLIDMADLLRAAGADWRWKPAPETALPSLTLDLTRLTGLIDLPVARADALVAEARASGWTMP